MTRAAAHKLARLLRAQGYRVRVRRHRAERLVLSLSGSYDGPPG